MNTYTKIIYQIVFHTKYNQNTLTKENRSRLFGYIATVLDNISCKVYKIGGIENHVHIVVKVHPSVSVSELVKKVKISSHKFIKEEKLFSDFIGWQNGYGAFTYTVKKREALIRYVSNQEEHHRKKNWKAEFVDLLNQHRISFKEEYLE